MLFETLLSILLATLLTLVVLYIVSFCIALVIFIAYELLRFVFLQVIPAPWRFIRWLFTRRRMDKHVADIRTIGAQARHDMEELTNEYLNLTINQKGR